jgi:uncharacterized membrane protein YhaH (DUF805 family)
MDFPTAIRTVLRDKYLCFDGRASRSEYWFFTLFSFLVGMAGSIISARLPEAAGLVCLLLLWLPLFLPSLGVSLRRLHDGSRSGWWLLIGFIPLMGAVLLLVWFVQKGTNGPNPYGDDPLKDNRSGSEGAGKRPVPLPDRRQDSPKKE